MPLKFYSYRIESERFLNAVKRTPDIDKLVREFKPLNRMVAGDWASYTVLLFSTESTDKDDTQHYCA